MQQPETVYWLYYSAHGHVTHFWDSQAKHLFFTAVNCDSAAFSEESMSRIKKSSKVRKWVYKGYFAID